MHKVFLPNTRSGGLYHHMPICCKDRVAHSPNPSSPPTPRAASGGRGRGYSICSGCPVSPSSGATCYGEIAGSLDWPAEGCVSPGGCPVPSGGTSVRWRPGESGQQISFSKNRTYSSFRENMQGYCRDISIGQKTGPNETFSISPSVRYRPCGLTGSLEEIRNQGVLWEGASVRKGAPHLYRLLW